MSNYFKKNTQKILNNFYLIQIVSFLVTILVIYLFPFSYFSKPFFQSLVSLYEFIPFFNNLKIHSINYPAVAGIYATSITLLGIGFLLSLLFLNKSGFKVCPSKELIKKMALKQKIAIAFLFLFGCVFISIVYSGQYVNWLYECIDSNQVSNRLSTLCKKNEYMPDYHKYPHIKSIFYIWGAICSFTVPYLGIYGRK